LRKGNYGSWTVQWSWLTWQARPGTDWNLAADRKGQHSIRINDQWRLCFRWHDGDAYDVEIVDYH
jgi:plasmid maintenance system killer protein